MVTKRKAQAAMEFLMTYGWAILVVLVVIGALAYFGVLNPQNLLPEKCTLPMGLYCKDHLVSATDSYVSLKLENGMGTGIVIRSIEIEGDPVFNNCNISDPGDLTDGTAYNHIEGRHISNGESTTIKINDSYGCTVSEYNGKIKGEITMTYCDDTSGTDCADFEHTIKGELMATVE